MKVQYQLVLTLVGRIEGNLATITKDIATIDVPTLNDATAMFEQIARSQMDVIDKGQAH